MQGQELGREDVDPYSASSSYMSFSWICEVARKDNVAPGAVWMCAAGKMPKVADKLLIQLRVGSVGLL